MPFPKNFGEFKCVDFFQYSPPQLSYFEIGVLSRHSGNANNAAENAGVKNAAPHDRCVKRGSGRLR